MTCCATCSPRTARRRPAGRWRWLPTSASRWTSPIGAGSSTGISGPANVMLSKAGVIKVMDFGTARVGADGQANTTATAVVGTAHYLSPGTDQRRPRRRPLRHLRSRLRPVRVALRHTTFHRPFAGGRRPSACSRGGQATQRLRPGPAQATGCRHAQGDEQEPVEPVPERCRDAGGSAARTCRAAGLGDPGDARGAAVRQEAMERQGAGRRDGRSVGFAPAVAGPPAARVDQWPRVAGAGARQPPEIERRTYRSATTTGDHPAPAAAGRLVAVSAAVIAAIWLTLMVVTAPPIAPKVSVPDLSGMTLEQAQATLRDKQLTLGTVDRGGFTQGVRRAGWSINGRPSSPRSTRRRR